MTVSQSRMRRSPLSCMGLLVALAFVPAAARAQEGRGAPGHDEVTAQTAADAGAFSVWSTAPRSDTQRALTQLTGTYDVARGGALFETLLEARVIGRLSLRAGSSFFEPDRQFRPLFGAKVDALRQEDHGLDLAITSGYEPYGFNTVPAVATHVSAGRSFGSLRLLANAGYGYGLAQGEHYGDVRAAALYRVHEHVRVGLDSRVRVDLERDSDEPEGEPDWEAVAGPSATLTAGPFAVTGVVGVSAIRRRLETVTATAPLAYLSLSAVF